jgi:hypothetical protein
MDLTDDERDLILAGLFELTITYVEDDEKTRTGQGLVRKLGGDPSAAFFRVALSAPAPAAPAPAGQQVRPLSRQHTKPPRRRADIGGSTSSSGSAGQCSAKRCVLRLLPWKGLYAPDVA